MIPSVLLALTILSVLFTYPAFNTASATSTGINQIGNYAIFGITGGVHLESNNTVTSGDVGEQNAGSQVTLEPNSKILPGTTSALVGDTLTIGQSTVVQDVFYNHLTNHGTIQGTQNTPLVLPVVSSLPAFPTFTAGTIPITVNSGSSLILQPGNYSNISVGSSATLEFAGGIYNIKSLTAADHSNLLFDNKTQVRITNAFDGGIGVTIKPSSSASIDASGIIFFVTQHINLGKNGIIKANMYAPNDQIHFQQNTVATGAFIANSIHIEPNSRVTLLSAFAPAGCITPPPNLVGWWPADGNTNDLAGGHTGTISGGVTFAPGKVAQAFSFDGTGSVSVGSLGISSDTQPFSIIAWVNPSASAINDGLPHTIVAEGSTANGFGNGEFFTQFSLTGSSGLGKLEIEIGATQTYSRAAQTSPIIPPNQWSLVAVTYDGSRTDAGIHIYVNGVQQSTTLFGSGFTLTGSPRDQWAIGSQIGLFDPFGGLIDETEIFNTAVTQQVIQSEFNADSAGKCKPASTGSVIATIPVGSHPTYLTFDSANGEIYSASYDDNTVSAINGATNTVVATIPVAGVHEVGIAFDSSNGDLYVANLEGNSISVINGATNTVVGSPIPVGSEPFAVTFDSANGNIYVTNFLDNTVSVINGATNTVVGSPISVGSGPDGIAFDSANGNIYVTNYNDNTVSVINGATNTVVTTISVGNGARNVAFDSANGNIYVTNYIGNSISVINGATNTVSATIPDAHTPQGIAFDSANGNIYVTNYDGSNTVSTINTTTNTIVGIPITVGNGPYEIAFDSTNRNLYVSNYADSTVSVIQTNP